MRIIERIIQLRDELTAAKRNGKSIGATPTMGAFHEGHLTLMRRMKAENDIAVVTIFVNPTQFNDAEDFKKYPRDIQADIAMAEQAGVDYLFTPSAEEMYPKGFDTFVCVKGLSDRLEGKSRPGHFNGVATVVAKLLNIVQADRAYFGEKDWQQLLLIKRMVGDLNINTAIVPEPIVRETDGLAMSSRNMRLTPEHRKAALVLNRALDDVEQMVGTGMHDAYQLSAWLHQTIAAQPAAGVDYAVVVDPETMQDIDTVEHGALAAVAVYFGNTRLIDNRLIAPPDGPGLRR